MAGTRRRHKPDYWLPILATGLMAIGLIVVYSISPGMSALSGVPEGYYVTRQLIAIALGVIAFVALSRIPYQSLRKFIRPLIILSVISALAVQFLGDEINGAYRWIQVGPISFQPVELIKFTALLWLADLLATSKSQNKLNDFNTTIKPLLICGAIIFAVVAVLQSDFGSTLVMVIMMLTMIIISGFPLRNIFKITAAVIILIFLVVGTSEYRRDRVATYLNPTADCQNSGYQACQALIAVGSGGIFGLGLARSVQAYGYLPEAANDSIFAIIAEKFGFLGVSIIISMFAVIFTRLTRIIEKAPDDFSRLIVAGVLAWLSFQASINIGAMLGVIPLKGITLPFISYGGTSLLFVTAALGITFQISRYSSLSGNAKGIGVGNENYAYRRGQRRPHYASVSRRT